jgi:hypothetical protein
VMHQDRLADLPERFELHRVVAFSSRALSFQVYRICGVCEIT